MRLLLLRFACWPLSDMPPRQAQLWKAWIWLMEARYDAALAAHGRDFARRYDYIPF